jgi:hypothetical protein
MYIYTCRQTYTHTHTHLHTHTHTHTHTVFIHLRILLRLLVYGAKTKQDVGLLIRIRIHLQHSGKGLLSMFIGPTALIQHPNAIPH